MAGSVARDRPTVRSWHLGRYLDAGRRMACRPSAGHAIGHRPFASAYRRPAIAADAGSGFATWVAKRRQTSQLVAAPAANTKERLCGVGFGSALQRCGALASIANRQGSPMMRQTTAGWGWSLSLLKSQRVV
ncbi:hypothetical protein [Xanthomonas nasturtii]|uniref:hypothetical protein n=1 Tax=Xanthomonas nasturtii TaxID=1843581 RepID=UPI002012ECC2|nr:hypothetical protein [Xanthomonas nasturtii]